MSIDESARLVRFDPALITAASTGERTAVDELLAGLRPLVLRYCRARLDRVVADRCAQETLLAVLADLPRRPAGALLPFVFGIAYGMVAEELRRHPRVSPADPLDRLPADQRDLLTFRVVLGFSAEQTAEALGLPNAAAVRVGQHRALTALRGLLSS
ncbi:sigma factor-like helix-turn-helix DNA-binding protein [Amycolatopsis jejuensis]|uniref:sigma factor-like helix-turn-helix DNA-binding protein n=1 Tax=Amycolatopsis jejuensis TaxID=330084 RepID=UPI0007C51BF5|nr:sigma factor-like helix-turn-helix DNA-binding protein [Amycolatopsis jejuensis]